MSTPLANEKKRYIAGLDGLRALAIIAVIAYHLDISRISGGFLGVDIFFVLSGYLVTNLLIERRRDRHRLDLSGFWVRRFRRLFPALIVMLMVVVAWATLFDRSMLQSLRGDVGSAIVYANNWRLIFHQVSYFEQYSTPAPLIHLWSLSVEGQFYIIWPLLLTLGLRFTPKRIQMVLITLSLALASMLAMILLYQPGSDPSRVYYGTDTRVFALLIGATLALMLPSQGIITNPSRRTRLSFEWIGWLGLAAIVTLLLQANEFDDFLYRGGFMLAAISTAMVIIALIHPFTWVSKLFSLKPLRWIGMRSYGIYLWHYPIITLSRPSVNTGAYNWKLALIQVAASVILASMSYKYVEEPIRRGQLSTTLKQIKKFPWKLRQLSVKQWTISSLSAIIIILFVSGMILHVPATASTAGEVVSVPALAQPDPKQGADQPVPPKKPNNGDSEASFGKDGKQISPGKRSNRDGDSAAANTDPGSDDPSSGHKPEDMTTKQEPGLSATLPNDSKESGKDSQTPKPVKSSKSDWGNVTAIGDSVMLDGKPYLEELLPGIKVDAEIGRQMSSSSKLLTQLQRRRKLGDTVIIGLGTNGVFNKKQLESGLGSLRNVKHIVLINTRVPRKWESQVNKLLADISSKSPDITLVNWYDASENHDEYFAKDGVHLTKEGSNAYAQLIANTLSSIEKQLP